MSAKGASALQEIFNQTLCGIAETDLTGRFVQVNPRYCHIVGRSAEELLGDGSGSGLRMQDITHPEDLKRNLPLFDQAVSKGAPFIIEKRYIRPDGSHVWVSNSVSIVRDEQGNPRYAVAASLDITERKQAEQALLESEERFRAFITASSDVVYRMSPDWSEMRDFVGREFIADTPEPGRTWLENYIHPDDQQYVMDVINEAIRTKGLFELEHRVLRVDGTLGWTFSRVIPLLGDDGEIIEWFGAASDVTERKEAEEELVRITAESERQRRLYDAILSNTPDLAYIFDLDHRFTYANEGLLKMWGKSWDETIGKNCLELGYEPWHAEMHDREIEKVIATKEPIRGQVPFAGTFGRRIYDYIFVPVLDKNGDVEAIAGTTRDVTEREQLLEREEAARREAELQKRHLISLFTQAPTPIVILRGSEYVIEFANAHTLELWGRRHEDVIEKPLFEVLPEIRNQVFSELLDGVRRTGEPYVGRETPAELDVHGDGKLQKVYLNFVYSPLRNVQGEIEGVLVIAFDVTHEILARDRMSELRAEAEVANRTKDEFLAMLGHELRNPLAPILTALQLMRLRGGDELSKERAVIERQARQLVRLIDDLLDVSRITRGKIQLRKERVEMAEVVAKAIETGSPLLEQREHELSVTVPRRGLAVDGDVARLTQVVANLLNNAAKYTEQGGSVTVDGERRGDDVVLTVKDTGIGMTPALLSIVFDRFTQGGQSLDRAEGGLGLGLAVARSLVMLHGGSISAASGGEGKGSEFTVRLPLAAPSSVGADRQRRDQPPSVRRSPGRQHRILVVDDNRDAADSLAEYLTTTGHVTCVAHDGPEALKLAVTFSPEVALIDLGLPVMDGYEVAGRLRARGGSQHTRLIAVTGYGQSTDRQRSREAGFDDHLVKPVDFSRLQQLLDDAVPPP